MGFPPGWTTDPDVVFSVNGVLAAVWPGGADFQIEWGIPVALIPVAIAATWQLSGFVMAMYLGGLSGIPHEVREAARIDGASEGRIYRKVIIPMMCIGPIFDSPSSTFSVAVSLFPPATPMLMFARIAMQPGPEMWEIALGVVLAAAFATACVWAAGKVFRVGVLSQGQAPSFARLAGWVLTK